MSKRMKIAQEKKEMEAAGYRLVQVWVPDYLNPNYLESLAREVASINEADKKDDIMDWAEAQARQLFADMPDEDWDFGDDEAR